MIKLVNIILFIYILIYTKVYSQENNTIIFNKISQVAPIKDSAYENWGEDNGKCVMIASKQLIFNGKPPVFNDIKQSERLDVFTEIIGEYIFKSDKLYCITLYDFQNFSLVCEVDLIEEKYIYVPKKHKSFYVKSKAIRNWFLNLQK